MIFILCKFILSASLDPLVGQFSPKGHMFDTHAVDEHAGDFSHSGQDVCDLNDQTIILIFYVYLEGGSHINEHKYKSQK